MSTPSYVLKVTHEFERELEKFLKKHKHMVSFVENAFDALESDPYNHNKTANIKKLINIQDGDGAWRIRLGDARIRYDIEKDKVILHTIGLRKDIYR